MSLISTSITPAFRCALGAQLALLGFLAAAPAPASVHAPAPALKTGPGDAADAAAAVAATAPGTVAGRCVAAFAGAAAGAPSAAFGMAGAAAWRAEERGERARTFGGLASGVDAAGVDAAVESRYETLSSPTLTMPQLTSATSASAVSTSLVESGRSTSRVSGRHMKCTTPHEADAHTCCTSDSTLTTALITNNVSTTASTRAAVPSFDSDCKPTLTACATSCTWSRYTS
mmetsp:Transcript_23910/g.70967  ORF Transcript_23910/g.70967 Transcript_23910/m.70967 type:complete len:230 (+) Transcript_23910:305-994(+)